MANKMMMDKVVVVDIEATCWKGHPPGGQKSEIIEIGVCLLDPKTGELSDKRSIMVKPTMSKVSEFCTNLTTITQEQVDEGIGFAEACRILRDDYLSSGRVFASFGDYDRKMFTRQCRELGVRYPFGPRHVNVKTYAALHLGLPKEVGMIGACKAYGIVPEGTHHRGDDDAWNIAKILAKALGKEPK